MQKYPRSIITVLNIFFLFSFLSPRLQSDTVTHITSVKVIKAFRIFYNHTTIMIYHT